MEAQRSADERPDLAAWLASAPLGAFHFRLIGLCFAIAAVDGFDTQCIAFVAPRLLDAWELQPAAFGPLFSAGLFGTMLGAAGLGSAADRFGRRTLILLCVVLFGLMSLLSATAESAFLLGLYRFVGGLGLGGVIPNIITLTSEYAPVRHRATMIVAMFCGFPIGALLGGAISVPLMNAFGWEAVFVLGGVLPLLLAALSWFELPESARFLRDRGDEARLTRVLRRVGGDVPGLRPTQTSAPSSPVSSLFQNGRAGWTLLLWVLFFAGMLLTYLLINWTPLLLYSVGMTENNAIMAVVLFNAGGVVGGLLIGRLMDRFGMAAVLASAFVIGTVCVLALGLTIGMSALATLTLTALVGMTVFGAQMNFGSLAACNYPVRIRGAAVGWAMAVGRFGSVIGPLLGGALIGAGMQTHSLFAFAAIPAAAAFVLLWIMKRASSIAARD